MLHRALTVLCFERGYRVLTVEDLCARAGHGRVAFERHYADLEDCFCAVYAEARDELFGRIRRAAVGQRTWCDRIRAAAYVFIRFLREDPARAHLSVVEVLRAGERAQLLFFQASQQLFDLIDQGREAAPEESSMTRASAESIGGGIFAQIYAAVGQGEELREEAVPELMYAAVLPYIGSQAAQRELDVSPPRPDPARISA